MPRELITFQIGQCGNQVASRFWDLAFHEHASQNLVYDEAWSSFFKNIDKRNNTQLPFGEQIRFLKARAICIDMEEGVLASLLKSEIADLFDNEWFIQDNPGSGNNWAVAHFEYGPKYAEAFRERTRIAVEQCDSL